MAANRSAVGDLRFGGRRFDARSDASWFTHEKWPKMKSVIVIPGRAPHWVDDHARHLAQRCTETGRVMVVYTHDPTRHTMLPGRPGNGSVLGHSVAGYPIWTGRLSSALGLRRSSKVTVIVLWVGANPVLALWSAVVARLRREHLILDIPEVADERPPLLQRIVRPALNWLASEVVQGTVSHSAAGGTRVILVLCGDDIDFAQLAMQTFEGMSDAAAGRWTLLLQVNENVSEIVYGGSRRTGKVMILTGDPPLDVLRSSDVLVADFGGQFEDFVHQAVLTGGAGVVVGHPVAGRVARCHDGVWLAQWDSASILVALEASSGDMFERPGTVAAMRQLANEVIQVVEQTVAA